MNAEVEGKVRDLIVDKLNVELSEITHEANSTTDLGTDSFDTIELTMTLEGESDITVSDKEAEGIKTIGNTIDYIEKQLA